MSRVELDWTVVDWDGFHLTFADHKCIYIYMYLFTCMQAYMYIYIYIHIYICVYCLSFERMTYLVCAAMWHNSVFQLRRYG